MFSQDITKNMMDLFSNPLFKKSVLDFSVKMQMEGIEAAKKFWNMSPARDNFPFGVEMFEKMADFYIILGFVPPYKYEETLKENQKLKKENEFLKETMKQLQMNLFTETGEMAQGLWESVINKQFELHKDLSKQFFGLLQRPK